MVLSVLGRGWGGGSSADGDMDGGGGGGGELAGLDAVGALAISTGVAPFALDVICPLPAEGARRPGEATNEEGGTAPTDDERWDEAETGGVGE